MPEIIELSSGKNTAELAVIAENLRVFRILRSLKMVSKIKKKNTSGSLNVPIKMFPTGDQKKHMKQMNGIIGHFRSQDLLSLGSLY